MNELGNDTRLSLLVDGELDSDELNSVLLDVLDNEEARERLKKHLQMRQMLAAWRHQRPAATTTEHVESPRSRLRYRFWMPMAACVALACVGWGMYLVNAGRLHERRVQDQQKAMLASLSHEEIAERTRVFNQVSQVFDQRAGWVLISDQTSDLGLSASPTDADTDLLLVRLSAARDEQVISTADLMVVAGESARVEVPSSNGSRLHYEIHTSRDEPGQLQIAAEVIEKGEVEAVSASLASHLQLEAGRTVSAGEVVSPSGRYQLSVAVYQAPVEGEQL
jgi:hypothetical protein